jgi:hypothetical protein
VVSIIGSLLNHNRSSALNVGMNGNVSVKFIESEKYSFERVLPPDNDRVQVAADG